MKGTLKKTDKRGWIVEWEEWDGDVSSYYWESLPVHPDDISKLGYTQWDGVEIEFIKDDYSEDRTVAKLVFSKKEESWDEIDRAYFESYPLSDSPYNAKTMPTFIKWLKDNYNPPKKIEQTK